MYIYFISALIRHQEPISLGILNYSCQWVARVLLLFIHIVDVCIQIYIWCNSYYFSVFQRKIISHSTNQINLLTSCLQCGCIVFYFLPLFSYNQMFYVGFIAFNCNLLLLSIFLIHYFPCFSSLEHMTVFCARLFIVWLH